VVNSKPVHKPDNKFGTKSKPVQVLDNKFGSEIKAGTNT